MTLSGKPRLVVFADDWGRHPSSAQHIARHLRERYEIHWVNIAGTRRPSLSMTDLRRALERLRLWVRPDRQHRPTQAPLDGIHVHTPFHWPGFRTRLERLVNATLLDLALRPLLDARAGPLTLVTTHPLVGDIVRRHPELDWVYYLVDDLAVWPGLDGRTLREMETQMLPRFRTIIAASDVLQRHVQQHGQVAQLLTHGVDLAHWAGVARRPLATARQRPTALYWGYADARLDVPICLAVAERCDLQIVGPRGGVHPRLLEHPGIVWRNPVPYDALPRIAEAADVLVMPYARLPVTDAMQPLKLKEYLATPLPVVSTPLPSTSCWTDALDLASDPEQFAALCEQRAREELPAAQAIARRRLETESWAAKAQCFEEILARSHSHKDVACPSPSFILAS